MPYRIFPLNLTSGDTIQKTGFALEAGYENPGSGDPRDAVLTAVCTHVLDLTAEAVSDMRGYGSDTIQFPLDHDRGYSSVIVRGVICSMDPFLERDSFEITNITVSSDRCPVFEVAEAIQRGRVPVLKVRRGKETKITIKYNGRLAAGTFYFFKQTVGRHGVPTIREVYHYEFAKERAVILPADSWDQTSRWNVRLALADGPVIKDAITIPIEPD